MKKIFFEKTVAEASRATGISYPIVWRHAHGAQRITAEMAVRYSKALGIPLWQLRPDLWEAPAVTEKEAVHE